MSLAGWIFTGLRAGLLLLAGLAATAANPVLTGTQTRGQGRDGVLQGAPLHLPGGGVIASVRCDGDGFWLEGPGGVVPFRQAGQALNQVLARGTYKAFPYLKARQDRASVALEIRRLGGAADPDDAKPGSPFDGLWPRFKRQHTDCSYAAECDLSIATDASGATWLKADFFGEAKGKVTGRTCTFQAGLVDGVPSFTATLEISPDGRSLTGAFSSKDGHRGRFQGARAETGGGDQGRAGSPFDGPWPRTHRQHTDCSYSAVSDLTISTDAQGVSTITSDFLGGARGRCTGNTCVFEAGPVGGRPTSTVTLVLAADGRSFTGTFASNDGHRGRITGSR